MWRIIICFIGLFIFKIDSSFSQKTVQLDKRDQRIIDIDIYTDSIDNGTYPTNQEIKHSDAQYDLIKTVVKTDSTNNTLYKYELKFNDQVKIESKNYYYDSQLVLSIEAYIVMIEKDKLDHDGMPIRNFPTKKTRTYYSKGRIIRSENDIID